MSDYIRTPIARKEILYSDSDIFKINLTKQIVQYQIQLAELTGQYTIYDNQKQWALIIVEKLLDRKLISITVIAYPQAGKTGTMLATISLYLENPSVKIPIENIYIITAYSSTEWRDQTILRFPDSFQGRVLHRQDLLSNKNKFLEEIRTKKNILIIMDEVHIAAKKDETLFRLFKEAGFYDINELYERDIKIVEFTATPNGTIYDSNQWGKYSTSIILEPDSNYTSCFDLMDDNRIFQNRDLCCYDKKSGIVDKDKVEIAFKEIKDILDNYGDDYLYHIFRTPTNKMQRSVYIDHLEEHLGEDIKIIEYDEKSKIGDINDILRRQPKEHTFILIKEKCRCTKTIYKKYIGICYERYANKCDDSVINQAAVGRLSGYDDNEKSVCFTNIESIERYAEQWKSNFNDNKKVWACNSTRRIGGKTISKGTHKSPTLFEGLNKPEKIEDNSLTVISYGSFDSLVKECINIKYQLREGIWIEKINKSKQDGVTVSHIMHKFRGTERVYSLKEACSNKGGIDKRSKVRIIPCYEKIEDLNTIRWVVIFKKDNNCFKLNENNELDLNYGVKTTSRFECRISK